MAALTTTTYLIIALATNTTYMTNSPELKMIEMPSQQKCNEFKQHIEQQLRSLRPKAEFAISCKPL